MADNKHSGETAKTAIATASAVTPPTVK